MIDNIHVISGIYIHKKNISDQNVNFPKFCFEEIYFPPKCLFCMLTLCILESGMVHHHISIHGLKRTENPLPPLPHSAIPDASRSSFSNEIFIN